MNTKKLILEYLEDMRKTLAINSDCYECDGGVQFLADIIDDIKEDVHLEYFNERKSV